jgi:hypothetical protein
MRRLRTGGRLIALVAILGLATACGSKAVSSVGTSSKEAATTAAAKTATARPSGTTAGEEVAPTGVKHADLLDGVSCAGAQCVAVGAWYYGVKNGEHTLVEVWPGRTWSLQPSPDGPRDSWLTAVSCAPAGPPGTCLAVGNMVLAGRGGHWRSIAVTSDFVAVSCAGTSACMAVGTRNNRTLVFATWNGQDWRTGTMHAPPSQAQEFSISGVSCTAADSCVAVGGYSYGIGAKPGPNARSKTLAEQWNGSSWRLLPTVDVSHSDFLSAVSCVPPDDCTATGDNMGLALGERWNGKTWRAGQMPVVSSLEHIDLTGVSCVTADFCVASGDDQGEPIVESWNGMKWRLTHLPRPAVDNYSAQLTGVSCASTQECTAVGIDGAAASYAEQYAGGRWQLTATRNPL